MTPTPSPTDAAATETGAIAPPEVFQPEPAFGWTFYAETINGRFAMIGFVALVAIELLTHQSFFAWLGLR